MDFMTAVRTVLLEKYATFSGRARRSELWWFVLFSIIVSAILSVLDGLLFGTAPDGQPVSILNALYSLAVLLPSIAVGARRLHDTGRSGWWLLLALIPVLGFLVLIFFYVQRGEDGANQYGANPIPTGQ
jgi:uncharacterized membrane protein YhaH (DUF805 family)